jgi:outer membrane protein OmpA-like peptidoglycan-associated protein
MEALLLAQVAITEDSMRDLAAQRGQAVKDYLAGKQLPPERLFIGAAKTEPAEAKGSPRAELSLAL